MSEAILYCGKAVYGKLLAASESSKQFLAESNIRIVMSTRLEENTVYSPDPKLSAIFKEMSKESTE
ncbi:hypothetical protein KASIA_p050 [Shewanella phage vB_SspS_KASIA]|nr:hypothetical protein KASIA_p050 [Shewanella phage vB_SspS_KASIA]